MEPVEIEAEELLARCICHELDHLDGHLYPELASEMMSNEELEERERLAAEEG
ncbi:MAG: peptide deformylase [Lachnospiraceae bacterium]